MAPADTDWDVLEHGMGQAAHRLCPWCIADGGAGSRFGASFTDGAALGEDVPPEILRAGRPAR